MESNRLARQSFGMFKFCKDHIHVHFELILWKKKKVEERRWTKSKFPSLVFSTLLRPVRTSTSIAIESRLDLVQSCPHLCAFLCRQICVDSIAIRLQSSQSTSGKWNRSRSEVDCTGNEAITWQSHSLIEACVCRNVKRSDYTRNDAWLYCIHGEQTVSEASWTRYPETRLCNSE